MIYHSVVRMHFDICVTTTHFYHQNIKRLWYLSYHYVRKFSKHYFRIEIFDDSKTRLLHYRYSYGLLESWSKDGNCYHYIGTDGHRC